MWNFARISRDRCDRNAPMLSEMRRRGGVGARKVAAGYIALVPFIGVGSAAHLERDLGPMQRPAHRADRHEIARRPKAYRPILHGSTTSWPTAHLIAGALFCGKRHGHTRGTGGLTFSWLSVASKFLFNEDQAIIFYSYIN